MSDPLDPEAVEHIPCGLFVVTAAYDGRRSGVLARWVQRCSVAPPMMMVAMPKGQPVEPLIRDSRGFALCQVASDDRILHRKFATAPDRGDDPFVALSTRLAPSGAPIVEPAMAYMDCALVRVIDIETDHLLYVGLITGSERIRSVRPAVVFGENGDFHKLDEG